MESCFEKNASFLLNLSPDVHGRIDGNLAAEFARFGRLAKLPTPLTEPPEGWMVRK